MSTFASSGVIEFEMSFVYANHRSLESLASQLQSASGQELCEMYQDVFGTKANTTSRWFLIRRIQWGYQNRSCAGLSVESLALAEQLADDQKFRARGGPSSPGKGEVRSRTVESCRLSSDRLVPMPGSVLTREFKGKTIRASVLEDGFEWEGRRYSSLSALASAVAGTKWNGLVFFGLKK